MFMKAPPKENVFVLWSAYGMLSGAASHSQARVWLIASDPDPQVATVTFRYAYNDPATGAATYVDVGEIAAAEMVQQQRITVDAPDGRRFFLVAAPCVCGAGAIGYAGPMPDRHQVTALLPHGFRGVSTS